MTILSYTAYGLSIHSELSLPELIAVEQRVASVAIRLQKLDGVKQSVTQSSACFLGETPGVGAFLVRDGNEIIGDPAPGADESLLRTIILGPILAVLLRQRGLAVLHASSIVFNNSAIAFLGGSGWGKSTLAKAFYDRGHGVVTDDVMAVHVNEDHPQVLPGYPSVKLFSDVVVSPRYANKDNQLLLSRTEKRAQRVAVRFPEEPLPLRRLYALAVGELNAVEPIQPQDAFVELTRNSRAMTFLRDAHSLNAHMRQCARLVAKVPVCRLRRRPVLADLPEVIRLIEEDMAKNAC